MITLPTRAELRRARAAWTGRTAVVMTMGALHEGHAALLRAARADADRVLVTIFVNPTQFGPAEDFDRYPRTLEADLDLCAAEGVDAVFAPPRQEIYPGGELSVRVDPGPLGRQLEGASRPGFFHGVLTVVLKLLHLTRPDAAYFGEKDYQQLTLVQTMVRDLDVPVEIVGVPTAREADGLARASRNRYLSGPERATAPVLSRALAQGAVAAAAGAGVAGALAAAHQVFARTAFKGTAFAGTAEAKLDYLALRAADLSPLDDDYEGPARLLVAAWVGTTRLIDNRAVEVAG